MPSRQESHKPAAGPDGDGRSTPTRRERRAGIPIGFIVLAVVGLAIAITVVVLTVAGILDS